MIWAKWGAALMFLAVAIGAFGAHGLRGKIDAHQMSIYQTGVLYHLIHALGLFAVAWLSSQHPSAKMFWAGTLSVTGIFLFSGSLYGLAISGQRWLGAITPLGGLAFMAAWVLVLISTVQHQ